jgi:hypothetical protein
MPHQPIGDDRPQHDYDETVAPSNPPNAVVRPGVRRMAVWTYVGILVGFFLVVGAVLLFWAGTGRGPAPYGDRYDPNAVGTSGEQRQPHEKTPGGFDPSPDHDNTRSELEFRGAGEPQQGSVPGLSGLRNASSDAVGGRAIQLRNVAVERAEGNMFWVRDGDERASVMTAGGMPTVRTGQRIDLTGTIESTGDETRIRATRIEVK